MFRSTASRSIAPSIGQILKYSQNLFVAFASRSRGALVNHLVDPFGSEIFPISTTPMRLYENVPNALVPLLQMAVQSHCYLFKD